MKKLILFICLFVIMGCSNNLDEAIWSSAKIRTDGTNAIVCHAIPLGSTNYVDIFATTNLALAMECCIGHIQHNYYIYKGSR